MLFFVLICQCRHRHCHHRRRFILYLWYFNYRFMVRMNQVFVLVSRVFEFKNRIKYEQMSGRLRKKITLRPMEFIFWSFNEFLRINWLHKTIYFRCITTTAAAAAVVDPEKSIRFSFLVVAEKRLVPNFDVNHMFYQHLCYPHEPFGLHQFIYQIGNFTIV